MNSAGRLQKNSVKKIHVLQYPLRFWRKLANRRWLRRDNEKFSSCFFFDNVFNITVENSDIFT